MNKIYLLIFLIVTHLHAVEISEFSAMKYDVDLSGDYYLSLYKSQIDFLKVVSTEPYRLTLEDSRVGFDGNHGRFYSLVSESSEVDGVLFINDKIKDLVFYDSFVRNFRLDEVKISKLRINSTYFKDVHLENIKVDEFELASDLRGEIHFKNFKVGKYVSNGNKLKGIFDEQSISLCRDFLINECVLDGMSFVPSSQKFKGYTFNRKNRLCLNDEGLRGNNSYMEGECKSFRNEKIAQKIGSKIYTAADFRYALFDIVSSESVVEFVDSNISHSDLSIQSFDELNFVSTNMQNVDASEMTVENLKMININAVGMNFSNGMVYKAVMENVILDGSLMANARFLDVNIRSVSCKNCRMENGFYDFVMYGDIDFGDSDLSNSTIVIDYQAGNLLNLTETNLADSNLCKISVPPEKILFDGAKLSENTVVPNSWLERLRSDFEINIKACPP